MSNARSPGDDRGASASWRSERTTLFESDYIESIALAEPASSGARRRRYKNFSGDIVDEAIPDPIPNSEVKLVRANGTAWGICVGE